MASSPELPPLTAIRSGQLQLALQRELAEPDAVFLASEPAVDTRAKDAKRQRQKSHDEKKRKPSVRKAKLSKTGNQSAAEDASAAKAPSAAQSRRNEDVIPISSDGLYIETSQFFHHDQPHFASAETGCIDSMTAASRRRSWTPPDSLVADPKATVIDLENEPSRPTPRTQLRKGIQGYVYAAESRGGPAPKPTRQSEPRRTRIDLVNMPFMTNNGKKRKAKTKGTLTGPVTITEITTALFHAENATTAREVIENRKRRTESPAKKKGDGKRRKSKEKVGQKTDQGVLNPRAAQQKLDEYELCFGTFSQIAFSKDHVSEDEPRDQARRFTEDASSLLSASRTGAGMWTASSRLEGELLGDSSEPMGLIEDARGRPSEQEDGANARISNSISLEASPVTPREGRISATKTRTRKTATSSRVEPVPSDNLCEPGLDLQKPDFSQYTESQLAKEVRSYGFKPVKARSKMVALLDSCWESKNRLPLRSRAESNVPTSPSKLDTSDKTALSTPNPKVSWQAPPSAGKGIDGVIEIPDSEDDSDMTPIATNRMAASATAVSSIAPTEHQSLVSLPESEDVDQLITRAVRTSPFYKSILLYDPIVIEELGLWLNTTGLRAACSYDGEVGPSELIGWCRAQSVCWIYEQKRWHR